MLRKLLLTALLLTAGNASALTIDEAHQSAVPVVEQIVPGFSFQGRFHLAHDSWIGQDKFFDHGSFAFVLAQLSEDVFRPKTDAERGMTFTVNMVPWLVKEIVDGYGDEGASYKDVIWSGIGAGLALIIH